MIIEQSTIVTETLLCAPVWDTGYAILYGPTSSGLSTLTWANEALGLSLLSEIPETTAPSAQRPLFVPYVLGQRSPIWNDRIRGAWFDVDVSTTRTQLGDAVLEGVVNAERDVLEAVTAVTGTPCTRIVVTGGGGRVVRLNQWRTAIFDAPLWEGASEPVLGAALLAYWGTRPHEFPRPGIMRSSLDSVRLIKPIAQFTSRYERYCHAQRSLVEYTLAEGTESHE
jgi:sugar (pentulose or hexulose) kinase